MPEISETEFQRLLESEKNLKMAQALGHVGTWEVDLSTQEVKWSDETFELYERDTKLGPPDWEKQMDYYPAEEAKKLREYSHLCIDEGREFYFDLTAKLPSGKTAHFNASMLPVKDSNGRVVKLFGTVQDVTERKLVQDEERRRAEEISDLYNNAPCGYHSIGDDATILSINDTELKWLGYSREEVVAKKKFTDLLTPESIKTFNDNFPTFKQRGFVNDLEYTLVRKDGTVFPVLLTATALKDASGKFLRSRSTVVNYTERKKADDEVKRRLAEVEKLNKFLIDREDRIVEVKEEVNGLLKELGKNPKYKVNGDQTSPGH